MDNKLIAGVGVNDDGTKSASMIYMRWSSLLNRCYNENQQARNPSYIGCSVCDEWLSISNFKAWLTQDKEWFLKDIDKDLLVKGNKVYSPDTCVLVDGIVNRFMVGSTSNRGKYPLGVNLASKDKFSAHCSNPFTKLKEFLGYFSTPNEAHQAWKKRKHEFACQLADLQSDPRVASALRTRYL